MKTCKRLYEVIVAINLIAERTAIKSSKNEVHQHEEKNEPLPSPDPLADR